MEDIEKEHVHVTPRKTSAMYSFSGSRIGQSATRSNKHRVHVSLALQIVSLQPSSSASSSSASVIAGGPGEGIAPLHAAMAGDKSVLTEFLQDIGQEGLAESKTVGDLAMLPPPGRSLKCDRISSA